MFPYSTPRLNWNVKKIRLANLHVKLSKMPRKAKKTFAWSFKEVTVDVLKKKNVYRLSKKHVPLIAKLADMCEENLDDYFGANVDVDALIYKAFISLGVVSEADELVGVMILGDSPAISSVPPWCWHEWFRNLFGSEAVTKSNAVWVTYLAWSPAYESQFLQPLLEYFFSLYKYKEYALIAIPPGVKNVPFLGDNAGRILPKGYFNLSGSTTVGMMSRQHYVTKYKIRRAVEEDNDDLVPLLDAYSPLFVKHYGLYYFAEILTRCPEGRQVIVAEHEGYAVAVIVLNDTVNYDALNEHFELLCFNGLKKPHPNDVLGSRACVPHQEEMLIEDTLEQKLRHFARGHRSAPWRQKERELDERPASEMWDLQESVEQLVVAAHDPELSVGTESERSPRGSTDSIFSLSMLNVLYGEYESRLYSLASAKPSVMSTLPIPPPPPPKPTAHLPRYSGNPDAFAIEVVAARPGHEDALDLLVEASFEGFAERSYAVICVPSTHPPMALLARFVRVPPRPHGTFPDELFVLHRNAVMPEIEVRMAIEEDAPYVEEFFDNMYHPGDVYEQFLRAVSTDASLENSSNLAFVMVAYGQVVGVAILSETVAMDYVLAHYALYKWMDDGRHKQGSIAVLENLLVYPIFHNYSAFFLNQLHLLGDYSAIFYIITTGDMSTNKTRPLCNLLQTLVPIMPRNVQEFSSKYLHGDCMPSPYVTELKEPFSLFLSMNRLLGTKRIAINNRIVVVGSGDTSNSFLETLICTSHPEYLTTFTSVVVVSPHGLAHQKTPNNARDFFQIYGGHFNYRYMKQTALRSHLSVVASVMVKIERRDKRIVLADGTILPYDLLVLLVGEQYQVPATATKNATRAKEIPDNVFVINTDTDASNALKKVSEILDDDFNPNGKVIVYGHSLKSHCALAGLIEFGVPRELLVFVNPIARTFDVENLICYDNLLYSDPEVEMAVVDVLRREGITLYQGFFNDWELNVINNMITVAKFDCANRMLQLPCKCIFMYTEKYISQATFQAINDCGLVFDGRLVIDKHFRTNDPHIYAAGPVTKYSRKYHADHLSHLYYNPEEVGACLGRYIRELLLPERGRERARRRPVAALATLRLDRPRVAALPRFRMPLIKTCRVPGGLRYLHVTKPGKQIPVELEVTRSDYGQLFVTGDFEHLDKQGYFRIHINEFKLVETITCLSREDICVSNLIQVWGKHVKLLNNLQLRFELMLIPNLFEFFQQPWTCAIYHDRFADLMTKINGILLETKMESGETIVETVLRFHLKNEWKHLTERQKVEILHIFDDSDLRDVIENKVVDYVAANTAELPMYAHPNLIRSILHDYERSPMFQE